VNPSAGPARVLKGTVTMSKKKTVKRTSAPRTARKPKEPIDPRLQRVLDVLDEAFDECDDRSIEGLTAAVWGVVDRYLSNRDGMKRAMTVAVAEICDLNRAAALDDLLAIAEDEHRAHCACCRERHEKAAVAS
jgi:hypothetical protein